MKSVNDFRFSGPASDKRRYWGDERHIRLMAKKRLRPVVIVGYALLLHEADARAQADEMLLIAFFLSREELRHQA